MKTSTKWILAGSLLLMGIGIGLYVKRQINLLMAYCYKLEHFELIKISKEKIVLRIDMLIKNLSKIDADIRGYDMDILINGRYVTSVVSDEQQYIAPSGVSKFRMDINFDPRKFFTLPELVNLISLSVFDRKNFIIEIKGNVSAKHSFIAVKNMPISIKFSLDEYLAPSTNSIPCTIP